MWEGILIAKVLIRASRRRGAGGRAGASFSPPILFPQQPCPPRLPERTRTLGAVPSAPLQLRQGPVSPGSDSWVWEAPGNSETCLLRHPPLETSAPGRFLRSLILRLATLRTLTALHLVTPAPSEISPLLSPHRACPRHRAPAQRGGVHLCGVHLC